MTAVSAPERSTWAKPRTLVEPGEAPHGARRYGTGRRSGVTNDWIADAIDEVERTSLFAQQQLANGRAMLAPIRIERLAGASLVAVANALMIRGLPLRREAALAFQEYEQAVASLRATVVRALVEDEGVTLAEIARRMGVSRQGVTRLYEAAKEAERRS